MKSWHATIAAHIEQWSAQLGNRGWWPRYVYHFTDVRNAARIIETGFLYSRTACTEHQLMVVDNASPEVIQRTQPAHHTYVRLYFRPRTPTQFHNEGMRPVQNRSLGSHCPVPIFFCFDALAVLSQDTTRFSNGNMATRGVQYGDTLDFFQHIPFQYVFHDESIREHPHTIVFHRHAEVLVPDYLPLLPDLSFIACRTAAERQTLLHLLPPDMRPDWASHIRIADLNLFERRWTFVEEVVAVDDRLTVRFNPSTQGPGPFHVRITYREGNAPHPTRTWENEITDLDRTRWLRMPNATSGEVRLYLDDNLAFAGNIIFDDMPF